MGRIVSIASLKVFITGSLYRDSARNLEMLLLSIWKWQLVDPRGLHVAIISDNEAVQAASCVLTGPRLMED